MIDAQDIQLAVEVRERVWKELDLQHPSVNVTGKSAAADIITAALIVADALAELGDELVGGRSD